MKKAMMPVLVWLVVLGLAQVSQADLASVEKLTDPQHIRTVLEQGQGKVKVIVNLAKRQEPLTATDWNSRISSSALRAEILTRQQKVLSTLTANDFSLRHRFENQPGFSAEVTVEGLNKLLNDPRVQSIEPVYALEEHLAQGIPLINAQGYRPTYNGQGVAIAVCDSGVDYYHPMLGNGSFPNSKVIGGYDFGDNDSDPSPNGFHGTACAGIAAGDVGAVGDYVGGVAHGAVIYALKAKDSSGVYATDSVVRAWDWCVTHKNDNASYPILVISTSLGGGRFFSTCDGAESALATAANNAVAAGITLLVSSGNDGYCDSIASPACLTNTISVGAVYDAALGTWALCLDNGSCASPGGGATCDPGEFSATDVTGPDSVTVYSNTASFLDILAPAHNAYTTDISGTGGYSAGDYISTFGGTSAACPYAAGAVACLQSAAMELTGSYLSPSKVRNILISTGDNITDDKITVTKPRINLDRAIDSIISPPPSAVTEYHSLDVPQEFGERVMITSRLSISDAYQIKDVDVKFSITHPCVEDLTVFLIAPDGTRIELLTFIGDCSQGLSDTILDDEAETLIDRGSPPFEGAYRPEGTLADLDGKNVNGIWALQITDFQRGGGTLNSWSLIIEPDIICPLPPVPANPNPPDGDENAAVDTCLWWNGLDGASYMDTHSSRRRTRRIRATTGSESSHYPGAVFVLDDLTFSPQQEQDCPTTWDVYLGTQADALAPIAGDLAAPNHCPGGLEADTWYYWQVIANNPSTQMPGPIWSFRTTAGPVAKCQDVTVPADSNCLGRVTVEDVNYCSYDPDGDPISLGLDPAGPYAVGDHNVTLIVTDDKGTSDSNSATVTVLPTAYCYKKDAIAVLEGILDQDPNAVDLIEAIAYLYLSLGDNDAAGALADMNDSQVAWAGPDRIAEWQGGFADANVFEYEQQACAGLDAYVHDSGVAFAADVNDALLLLAEAEKKLADTAIFDAIFHGADPNTIAAAKTLRSQADAAKAEGGMKICNVALAKYAQAWQMAIDTLGPAADHNRDAQVDIEDFVIWGEKWLQNYPPDVD